MTSRSLAREFTIREDFPPAGYDEWRELAEAALKGASFDRKLVTPTYDGIDIQPIYTRRDQLGGVDPLAYPGLPPFVRGSRTLGSASLGWDLRQEYAQPDLAAVNQAILADLEGGVTSLWIRLDEAARCGWDPDHEASADRAGRDGLMLYRVEDLDAVLDQVPLNRVSVALDAGAAFLPAAAMVMSLWQRRNVAPRDVRGAFNADPLGELARQGQLPIAPAVALGMLANLAQWTASHYPHVTAVSVDTSPYHDAGASAAQDLAFAMASAVEYLRAMIDAGLDIDVAAPQLQFSFRLETEHFLAIAKLRAARRLWSRVVEACGGSGRARAMRIHARVGDRVLTQRDAYVNLLRNSVAVFAAAIGGAEVITSVPFDAMLGIPSDLARRIARNTSHILQEESHLHHVIDPAGGSWYLDQLTEELADKAWEIFQQIERHGGMLAAIESERIAQQIDSTHARRARDIACRKLGITGVTEFPDIDQDGVVTASADRGALLAATSLRLHAMRKEPTTLPRLSAEKRPVEVAVMAAATGASIGQLSEALGFHIEPSSAIPRIAPRRLAEPFEALRDASDAWQAKHGRRPAVFLANMGPVAHHTARAAYAKTFFEAGGFEVVSNDGFADAGAAAQGFTQSHASIAVICSSDQVYPDTVPPVAAALKAAGARTVLVAEQPGEHEAAWRAAGVDRFIFTKCDALETLRDLLRDEGVLETLEG